MVVHGQQHRRLWFHLATLTRRADERRRLVGPTDGTRRRVARARRPAIRLHAGVAHRDGRRGRRPRPHDARFHAHRDQRYGIRDRGGTRAGQRRARAPRQRGRSLGASGSHTAMVAQGDTLRYVARSNGPDTLIATSDFCLAGAKCADTVIARVSQCSRFRLSTITCGRGASAIRLSPNVTLADRRGNGLAGTSIRFVPVSPADSAVVRVGPVVGAGDPATGVMATPRLISTDNGTATVIVQALAPDGTTILATDTVTDIVRQVRDLPTSRQLRTLMSSTARFPSKRSHETPAEPPSPMPRSPSLSIIGVTFHDPLAGPKAIVNVRRRERRSRRRSPASRCRTTIRSRPQVPVAINAVECYGS